MFWRFWRKKKEPEKPTPRAVEPAPQRAPAATAEALRSTAPAPAPARATHAATATAVLEPPPAPVSAPASARRAAAQAPVGQTTVYDTTGEQGWFTREDIEKLHTTRDESLLARRLMQLSPGATKEEVLFRYYLARAVLEGEYDLPVLPTTTTQIMDLTRQSSFGIADIVRVVESDAALVGAIVRAANSAFFASLFECTSVQQAIVRIGLQQVEQIALAQTLRSRLVNVKGQRERIAHLGIHGLATAIASKLVAGRIGASQPSAFLGGLFHDVGKLIVLSIVGSVQNKLRSTVPAPLVTSAMRAFHTPLGELACHSWELPEDICLAVRFHGDGELAQVEPLHAAVYLGNLISRGLDWPDLTLPPGPENDPVILRYALEMGEFEALRNQTAAELEAYKHFT